ncbi:MAG: hypothetical protein CMG67_00575 [Candidatus Marinimicrobia bacterium]|nr:hypothetical protein [Candidatus Neomarinimicrobiota bacterium]|tara:strand:- start:32250 stop:32579 length:330 start_codon:yes stop_codon:yes gene_type:complete
MFKKTILFTIILLFFLTLITSIIKNKARNLEKDILKLKKEISVLENNISAAEIDFIYVSNPEKIIKNLQLLGKEDYKNYDNSRVFFSIQHFIKKEFKESKLTNKNKIND